MLLCARCLWGAAARLMPPQSEGAKPQVSQNHCPRDIWVGKEPQGHQIQPVTAFPTKAEH